MRMTSRNPRKYRSTDGEVPLPLLLLVCVVMILLGFPACLLGFVAQRLIAGRLWSVGLWIPLSLVGGGVLWYLYLHGLDRLIVRQLSDVLFTLRDEQLNLARWNLGRIWSEIWPVWLQTLPAFPLIACYREVETQLRSDNTAATLVRDEQRRVQRLVRSKRRAKKRARRPERVPDEVRGQMVIGVTIDDEDTLE